MLQLFGQLHPNHVGPRAEHLAELDERGPQLDQGQAQAGLPSMPRDGHPSGGLEQVFGEARAQPADPVGQTVLAQDGQDLPPPIEMPVDVGNRADSHGHPGLLIAPDLPSI